MIAFGYRPADVRLMGIEATERRLCLRFCAARSADALAFDISADKTNVVLESAAPDAPEGWPDLFHRAADFEPSGPFVRIPLGLDADPDGAWPAIDAIASDVEREALRALIGCAALALETSARPTGSPYEPLLLSALQAQGAPVEPEVDDKDAAAPAVKSVRGALEAFRNVVEEYYTSPDWEHIRLQLDDVRIAGERREMVTFKLFRTPAALGLEFRPLLETGEHPFETFPGTERDNFGPYYRIVMDRATGAMTLPEAETLTPADRALIDGLIAALTPTMKAATIGVGHLDEKTYATWSAAGAAFQAAYGAMSQAAE